MINAELKDKKTFGYIIAKASKLSSNCLIEGTKENKEAHKLIKECMKAVKVAEERGWKMGLENRRKPHPHDKFICVHGVIKKNCQQCPTNSYAEFDNRLEKSS